MEFLTTFLWVLAIVVGCIIVIPLLGLMFGAVRAFKVNEGTGTAFKLLGRYSCSMMSMRDFHFENGEEIEEGSGSNITRELWYLWQIRGWIFYPGWFMEPTKYTDKNAADGFGDGFSVFLNQIQRDLVLERAETKGNIGLNFKAAFRMKVVNIYKFLFISPKDVIAKVIENMEAILRSWVKANDYEHVQEVASNGGKMCDEFGDDIKGLIKKMKDDWGVDILEESVVIMDVGLSKEDQEAFGAEKRQGVQAAGEAQKLVGRMLANAAVLLGVENGKAALAELQKTKRGKGVLNRMLEEATRFVLESELSRAGGFMRIEGDPLTALVGKLLRGDSRQPSNSGQPSGDQDNRRNSKDKEVAEAVFAQTGMWPSWWDSNTQRRR